MKASVSTTTRVMRPAPTSPAESVTDTVNTSRRPSTFSKMASAVTVEPTATGARWSTWTRTPTLVWPVCKAPLTARKPASSHSAMSRGVARTSTSPDPMALAVSAGPTVRDT